MANRPKIKVPVNSDILHERIKEKTSIGQIGPKIGYSEKTIRRGLKAEEMSVELVFLLGHELCVDPKEFADFDGYIERLKALIGEES